MLRTAFALSVLFPPPALARGHATPVLGIPVSPPRAEVGRSYVGLAVPLPSAARQGDPWGASDPRVRCEAVGDRLEVTFHIAGPADWPHELPSEVVCSQGRVRLAVPVAFVAAPAEPWVAADGTIVIPRRLHQASSGSLPLPVGDVRSAHLAIPAEGLSCAIEGEGQARRLTYDVAPDAAATGGDCVLEAVDGTTRDQPLALPVY